MFSHSIPQRKYVYPAFALLLLAFLLMRHAWAVDSVAPTPTKAGSDVVRSMDESRAVDRAVNTVGNAGRSVSASTHNALNRADAAARDSVTATERGARSAVDAIERAGSNARTSIDRSIAGKTTPTSVGMYNKTEEAKLENQIRGREEQLRGKPSSQEDWINGWGNTGINAYDKNEALIKRDAGYIAPIESKVTGRYVDGNPTFMKENDLAPERSDLRYTEERLRLDERRMSGLRDYQEKRSDLERQLSNATNGSNEYYRLQILLDRLDKEHGDNEQRFERDFRNMDARYSGTNW